MPLEPRPAPAEVRASCERCGAAVSSAGVCAAGCPTPQRVPRFDEAAGHPPGPGAE